MFLLRDNLIPFASRDCSDVCWCLGRPLVAVKDNDCFGIPTMILCELSANIPFHESHKGDQSWEELLQRNLNPC